ncbi:SMI1/KNR4 family protein [Candidatus Methylacidiphilum infernorum]|uniref:SMI1/KNR4 family protein n=1 Tax=Candidatus Methylacidiphilum infernorum TaxID=511746 RepID=A0ABX7PW08_9BACT|nr:SMI1/KNR4 family protein [Candidatus Methylacidiphilum infernorum]QSR86858.1 SMI1/KNR4 family protein [Candidatus Methylacidiphilum infernorum]
MNKESKLKDLLETLRSYQAEHPYIEFNPPASPQAIEEADRKCQEKFGIALPRDYKELLGYANGFSFGYGYFYFVVDHCTSWWQNRSSNSVFFLQSDSYWDLFKENEIKVKWDPNSLYLGQTRNGSRQYVYDVRLKCYRRVYMETQFYRIPFDTGEERLYEDFYSMLEGELAYFFKVLEPAPRLLEPKVIHLLQTVRRSQFTEEGSFLPPASPRAIEEAGRRFREELGIPLPDFYKAFLAFSNGFETAIATLFSIPDEDSPVVALRKEQEAEKYHIDYLFPDNYDYRSLESWESEEERKERMHPSYFFFGRDRDLFSDTYMYDLQTGLFHWCEARIPVGGEFVYPDFYSFLKHFVFSEMKKVL